MNLIGMIEARGIGILSTVFRQDVPVELVVDLAKSADTRMPEKQIIPLLKRDVQLISGKDVPNLASALMVKLVRAQT